MNRQTDSDPTVEAFLAKLDERYSMTRRLQANDAALDAAWDDYRHVLARFDKPTMDRAWQLLVEGHDSWSIPTIRDVLEACQRANRDVHPRDEIDKAVRRADELARAYMQRFMATSTAPAKAREGGYEPAVKRFVESAARVQAQYIYRRLRVQRWPVVRDVPPAGVPSR